jgi:hypothetical protein
MAQECGKGHVSRCADQRIRPDVGGRRAATPFACENEDDLVDIPRHCQPRLYCLCGYRGGGRPAGLPRRQAGMCAGGNLGGRFSDLGDYRRRDMLGALLSTALSRCVVR